MGYKCQKCGSKNIHKNQDLKTATCGKCGNKQGLSDKEIKRLEDLKKSGKA